MSPGDSVNSDLTALAKAVEDMANALANHLGGRRKQPAAIMEVSRAAGNARNIWLRRH